MGVWQLLPNAAPNDPTWQGRFRELVIVRARSPAFARAVCAELDTPEKALEFGQQDPRLGSGFTNEKLYRVEAYTGSAYEGDGPETVLDSLRRRETDAGERSAR